MRTCTSCGETKELGQFWRDRSKKHGYAARCKPCKAAIYNRMRKERGYDRLRYQRNKAAERERHLVRKYGITQADYEQMFKAQGGRCAVCRKPQSRSFDVDHDHTTGAVRGLLCTSCNRMIGHAGDSPAKLEAAAIYLRNQPHV